MNYHRLQPHKERSNRQRYKMSYRKHRHKEQYNINKQ